ncbi:hypothetical protein [Kocuria sp. TGY1127_2]|uniref:hypothetical protein n=1 Tax=Kocuria sp. TGY1127_2 TaxID=2711328 RepID=UPI0015BEF5F0|nr:hypothetical protein [Kocuria sp. TGY1127_2]
MGRKIILNGRATRKGGIWFKYRANTGGSPINSELSVLDHLDATDKRLVISQLKLKAKLATQGKLRVPRETKVMKRSGGEIASLRIQINQDAPREEDRLLFRLYYAEPNEVEKLLLALKFGRKVVAQGSEAQNIHIDTSFTRLTSDHATRGFWGLRAEAKLRGIDCEVPEYMNHLPGEEMP